MRSRGIYGRIKTIFILGYASIFFGQPTAGSRSVATGKKMVTVLMCLKCAIFRYFFEFLAEKLLSEHCLKNRFLCKPQPYVCKL